MALYPLPKIYHSDFQLPNKKPIGPVEIDLLNNNPPNIYAYMLGSSGGLFNLAKPEFGVIEGTNPLISKVVSSGLSLDFQNTQAAVTPDNARIKLSTIRELPQGYLLCEFYADTITGGFGFVFAHASPDNKRILFGTRDNDIVYRLGNGSDTFSTTNIALNTRIVALLTWDNGVVELYLNGKQDSTSTYTNVAGSDRVDITYMGVFKGATIGTAFDGQVSLLFMGDTHINEALGEELTSRPYQILKPKVDSYYWTIGEAPPSVTIPILNNHFRNQGMM